MKPYSRILVVLDLSEDSEHIARRAQQVATGNPAATLTLLHVVEFVPVEPLSDSLLPAVQIESAGPGA
jgi:universal stress protein A